MIGNSQTSEREPATFEEEWTVPEETPKVVLWYSGIYSFSPSLFLPPSFSSSPPTTRPSLSHTLKANPHNQAPVHTLKQKMNFQNQTEASKLLHVFVNLEEAKWYI